MHTLKFHEGGSNSYAEILLRNYEDAIALINRNTTLDETEKNNLLEQERIKYATALKREAKSLF